MKLKDFRCFPPSFFLGSFFFFHSLVAPVFAEGDASPAPGICGQGLRPAFTSVQTIVPRAGETRVSFGASGAQHVFTRVWHPKAKEGWRDPSGRVWYPVAQDKMPHGTSFARGRSRRNLGRSSTARRSGISALEYCFELGLELPSQDDFIELKKYLSFSAAENGDETETTYQPQVLPVLDGHWLWTSTVDANRGTALLFDERFGVFVLTYELDGLYSVLCIGRQ